MKRMPHPKRRATHPAEWQAPHARGTDPTQTPTDFGSG
jgi:hypothetical protein